jgi:hypothetical protein
MGGYAPDCRGCSLVHPPLWSPFVAPTDLSGRAFEWFELRAGSHRRELTASEEQAVQAGHIFPCCNGLIHGGSAVATP